MKNLYSTIILILLFNFDAIAQIKSNYERGFEIGFKEGYCYNRTTYDCFTPMTPLAPMPRINESKDNYTEGYNRGFQFGLDLKRTKTAMEKSDYNLNKIPKFNNYVSQNPVEAMRIVGMYKQQKYDIRTQWTQERINQLSNLIVELFNEQVVKNFSINELRKNEYDKIKKFSNSISTIDFADDYQFNSVKDGFNQIENVIYNNYNMIIKFENEIKAKEQSQVTKNNPDINRQTNNKNNFSGILEKYYGKYSCTINVYSMVNNNYILKETKSGVIALNNNILSFGTTDFTTQRVLQSEILDNIAKECTYKTEYGNVVIDYNFKKVVFFDLDNKNYYVYLIKNKI